MPMMPSDSKCTPWCDVDKVMSIVDEDGCLPGDACKHALFNAIYVGTGQQGQIKVTGALLEEEEYTVYEVLDVECSNPVLTPALASDHCSDPCCPEFLKIDYETKTIELNQEGAYLILFTGTQFSETRIKSRVCEKNVKQCC